MSPDTEVVGSSGLFDADYYRATNSDVAESGVDPLAHFCESGWRELRRPRADFDVWFYWTTYLDPAVETVNPFVHWVTEGRAAGFTGLPASTSATPGAPTLAPGARRLCLVAAFDRDARVDDHLVRYVTELALHADVYVLHDGYLPPSELARLDGIAKGAWAERHGAYDFGSWSKLAGELVGWDAVATYDELLLVNDSCYLLRPLDEVFAAMDATACDWWGLQATKGLAKTRDVPSNGNTSPRPVEGLPLDEFEQDAIYDFHVGSYFVAYRRRVIDEPRFRAILDSVGPQRGKLAVIQKYEIGIGHFLIGNGYGFATHADALYPFHPLFSEWHFTLIERGFPLLKKYFLYQNHYDVPGLVDWKERVLALVPDAPVDVFERDLQRTAPDDRLRRSFAITRVDDGTVVVPTPLAGAAFRSADKAAAKDDSWWAFPVCPDEHTLPANSRAILQQVRHDPAITKVVLTRSRRVDLDGANVVVLPLDSPEGQEHLMRCATIFVKKQPRRTVGEPLGPDHRIVLVRDGLVLDGGPRRAGEVPRVERVPATRWHAALTASDVDRLVTLGLNYPGLYSQLWRTGIPAHDFLIGDAPVEVAAEETALRAELAGRRLLLLAPTRGTSPDLDMTEVVRLGEWATSTGTAIGVREHPGDLTRDWSRTLEDVTLDLSHHRYPLLHAVLRASDAVLTDRAGVALDAAVCGRPVVAFSPGTYDGGPVLDLDHVFPGPVCRTGDQLWAALDELWSQSGYEQRLRLLADVPDGGSAARVVEAVRG